MGAGSTTTSSRCSSRIDADEQAEAPDEAPTSMTSAARNWTRARGLPLVLLAPSIVLFAAVATAAAITSFELRELRRTSDDEASHRALVLSTALAARLRATTLEDRAEIMSQAARRSGSELMLVDQAGQTVINETFGSPSREKVIALLVAESGETRTALGRVRFVTAPLGSPLADLSVVVFVAAPSIPAGSLSLLNGIIATTALLLVGAVATTYGFARSMRTELDSLRLRITEMARPEEGPLAEPVPLRSIDQVGAVSAAFNVLVSRFAAAERSYRADLDEAQRHFRDISAFLAGLSHELRTPLNSVLGFAHLMETEADGPLSPGAHENLDVIRTSGEHLRSLIDDILELSAIATERLRLSRSDVDVVAIAAQVAREASRAALNKNLDLNIEANEQVVAFVDPIRIRQILTNLVSNAVKFTQVGRVTVGVERRGSHVVLSVADTGPGLPASDLDAIFEVFAQAGSARARRAGTGLGLAIARHLVRLHGGTIHAESEVGQGSTFVVRLPQSSDRGLGRAKETP